MSTNDTHFFFKNTDFKYRNSLCRNSLLEQTKQALLTGVLKVPRYQLVRMHPSGDINHYGYLFGKL